MESASDRRLLYAAAFLRALATGMMGVLLGLHLSRLGAGRQATGFVIGAGLAGAAAAALYATLSRTRSRRATLVAVSLLGAAGGFLLMGVHSAWALAAVAFLGMVNGMGRDRGAALILEQALLPATTTPEGRTRVFAVYNLFQDAGHAIGGLLAGLPDLLRGVAGVPETTGYPASFGLYALLLLVAGLAYLSLSRVSAGPVEKIAVSPASRRILWKICALFALDSLGGGFLTTALLTYFFVDRFGVGGWVVGALFFAARVMNAISHLAAAWLAKRIGLVNTMVFTHIPSSVLLASVAFAPNFWIAALLFILREGLVEMDVPTRQSYVMAVVRPEERTFASGVTHLVRMGAWAVAPSFAGLFMAGVAPAAPLFAGAGLKIVYDVLLYFAFRNLKPPEEQGR